MNDANTQEPRSPGISPFDLYIRKWVVLAGIAGILTGLSVVVLDVIVRIVFLGDIAGDGGFMGITTFLYNLSPLSSFLLPLLGMVATGLVLMRFAGEPLTSGTDEVLEHYHFSQAPLRLREGFVKYLASILTIGLGGSAGLEGPSINSGAVVGSWLWKTVRVRFQLSRDDLRIMLLAGAAAGIAAIFKAPLTGIVFALEVPYKDDIARRAFFPSIISGVSSYVTFASFEGFQPLFSSFPAVAFTPMILASSALLGLIIAGASVAFSVSYNRLKNILQKRNVRVVPRLALGGLGIGLLALAGRLALSGPYPSMFGPLSTGMTLGSYPYTYGAGYSVIQGSLLGLFSIQLLLAILALRLTATALTLGTGGVGGIFFPQVLFGALIGSLFALLVQGPVTLYASVGMAAFMSAGYKTPLAAVTFIGDTTTSVSYLVPGMIASAIAYVVSGEHSVSMEQKLWEYDPSQTPIHQ